MRGRRRCRHRRGDHSRGLPVRPARQGIPGPGTITLRRSFPPRAPTTRGPHQPSRLGPHTPVLDAVPYPIPTPRRVARLVLLNTVFGNQPSLKLPEMTQLFAAPQLTTLADDLVGDPNQLLWLLQRWGVQWELDANDPEGIARNSILPQFYGDEHQPDAVASVRAWCAGLHDALDQQDALASSGALSHLHVPVSIIWGEKDQYLSPSLAAEIAPLFPNPSVHLLPGAGHWPQHDQPDTVAELLKESQTA